MQFLHPERDNQLELTFSDLFMVQQYSDISSRMNIDLTPNTPLSTTLPIISANMNSVTGKRMSETLARYGWMWILPQDMELEKMVEIINFIHDADTKFDTAITVWSTEKVQETQSIIGKRAHGAVVLVDEDWKALWIFTERDLQSQDNFTELKYVQRSKKLITAGIEISYEEAYSMMSEANISSLPIVDKNWVLKGMMTKKNSVRWDMYSPSLNSSGNLNVSVALWINAYKDRIDTLLDAWIDTIVLDTAHWFQKSMLHSVKDVRNIVGPEIQLIAGNICTWDGTKALIDAGVNGVKVGIGPGAMCTTRMQTWVGRPQFSAVKECADAAKELEWYVWADGWLKDPRDLALALAAGASHAMIWSILAWTFESTGDIKSDENGMYKESHWMASSKAVKDRNRALSPIEQARRDLYNEWISSSKVYMTEWRSSVWDLLDEFTTWLRSSMAYTWANNLEDFHDKVIVWVQSGAWYAEWKPHTSL